MYSYDEVIEILRQVMFTGTPEFYDNGGLHGNHKLRSNHTTERAKAAFDKYYLPKKLTGTIPASDGFQTLNSGG